MEDTLPHAKSLAGFIDEALNQIAIRCRQKSVSESRIRELAPRILECSIDAALNTHSEDPLKFFTMEGIRGDTAKQILSHIAAGTPLPLSLTQEPHHF